MTALVVTPTLPPGPGNPLGGVHRRFALFIAALAEGGAPITVLRLVPPAVIAEWDGRAAALDRLESETWGHAVRVRLLPRRGRRESFAAHYLSGILSIGRQPDFFPFCDPATARQVAEAMAASDTVLAHRLPAMCAVLAGGARHARLFFDLDDVEHRMRLRTAVSRPVWPGKLLYLLHLPALFLAERAGARRARASFVCSEPDRAHLQRLGLPRVVVAPNAVTLPRAAPPPSDETVITFLGTMSYAPNLEAAKWLIADIMPLIWARLPAARLVVAGHLSERLAGPGADPRIECLGYVEDLGALYARTGVVCAPVRNGGGTRVKLVEAAAYGRPIVATTVGLEGLALAPETEVLVRDDAAGIAEACLRLLGDGAARARLGAAARRKAEGVYDPAAVVETIRQAMRAPG